MHAREQFFPPATLLHPFRIGKVIRENTANEEQRETARCQSVSPSACRLFSRDATFPRFRPASSVPRRSNDSRMEMTDARSRRKKPLSVLLPEVDARTIVSLAPGAKTAGPGVVVRVPASDTRVQRALLFDPRRVHVIRRRARAGSSFFPFAGKGYRKGVSREGRIE